MRSFGGTVSIVTGAVKGISEAGAIAAAERGGGGRVDASALASSRSPTTHSSLR